MFVCCKAAEEAASACGNVICPENRPSPLYVIFTWMVSIVGIIITAVNFAGDNGTGDCTNTNLKLWNGVMFGICAVNMCFALYLYWRYCAKLAEGHGAFESAWKILLYDWGVYTFCWFSVFNIVWLAISGNWSSGENVCKAMRNVAGPVVCQIVFLAGTPFVVWFSLATECCREPRHMSNASTRPAPPGRATMGRPASPPAYRPVGPAASSAAAAPVVMQPAPQHQMAYAPAPQPQYVYAQPVAGVPVAAAGGGAAPPPMNPAYANPAYQPQHAYPAPQQQQQQPYYQQQPAQPNAGQRAVNAVKGVFR